MPKSMYVSAMLLLCGVLTVCGFNSRTARAEEGQKDIVDTAVAAGDFKTLATALEKAGLVDTLKGPGPFTVFAPTDAAFAKVPKKTLDALKKDRKALRAVLLYHVVAGRVTSGKVVKRESAKTLNGARVTFRVDGKKVFVNDARITAVDVKASNGVIHIINRVLIPPSR